MKKGIIIYQSKYGATQKYVQWLQSMTDFQCIKTRNAVLNDILVYDTIVFCGGIYASKIAGLSFLKKNIKKLKNKKIVILCVGASPYDEKMFTEIKAHNLIGDLAKIPLFYGRGVWDENKLNFMDKTLCKMLRKSIEKKAPNIHQPYMETLICATKQNCDWTDKKYLLPLLEYLEC